MISGRASVTQVTELTSDQEVVRKFLYDLIEWNKAHREPYEWCDVNMYQSSTCCMHHLDLRLRLGRLRTLAVFFRRKYEINVDEEFLNLINVEWLRELCSAVGISLPNDFEDYSSN